LSLAAMGSPGWMCPFPRRMAPRMRKGCVPMSSDPVRPIGRRIFRSDRLSVGVVISDLFSPRLVPVLARAGADWVFIDMEHTRFTLHDVASFIEGAQAADIPIIVRPPEVNRSCMGRLLDLGADGLWAPRTASAADAAAAARFTRYPPAGERGESGRLYAAWPDSARARDDVNQNTVLIALVESREGVENIDQICQTPGVDAVAIGHADLSLSLGIPGDLASQTYRAAEQRIVDACVRHAMPFQIGMAPTVGDALAQRARGCFTVLADDEVGLLTRALSAYTGDLRGAESQRAG
jgi:2-keto-3-deoxy-L-rhamnonate aldolase RhmA